jgi:hypothetical protein
VGRRLGVALVAAVVFAFGWLPQFGRPGYELALATGLVAPPVMAVAVALEQRRSRLSPAEALREALLLGCGAALAAAFAACVHGARTGFCEPLEGFTVFVLGPIPGIVLASVWGAFVAALGRAGRSRAFTVVGALAAPLAALGVGLAAFYLTPAVFAYSPFVGLFSGSLYDTVLVTSGLVTYRLASAATLVFVAVLVRHVDSRDSALRLVWRGRPFEVLLGVLALSGSAASVAWGNHLGHWQTSSTIADALGAATEGKHCRVVHEPSLHEEATLLARECDVHVVELSEWLGIATDSKLTAFLFRDAEQKRIFMGAAHTSIAKPWRAEIYVQNDEYPHPVLRHELAHALAAKLARGPFRVAGALGGWLPDPGLIEGLAEAAAPRDDELSADEWSAAMRTLGLLPRLEGLFGLGFFGGASSASYTAAGSFVGFVRERYGREAVARWYRGEALDSVVGTSRGSLESSWWAQLDAMKLSDAALDEARVRFDRPGLFSRSCPHAVDRMLEEAAAREQGDPARALALFRSVLTLDPGSARALFGVAACEDRAGRSGDAEAELRALTGHGALPLVLRATAHEKLGDLALRAARVDDARAGYAAAGKALMGEDRLRTLELKTRYAGDPVARRALVALLVGADATGPSIPEALDELAVWHATAPGDGVPSYLIGRQLVNARRRERAAERLDEALSLELPPRIEAEALRLRIRLACARGDGASVRPLAARFDASPVVAPARKRWFAKFVARCE